MLQSPKQNAGRVIGTARVLLLFLGWFFSTGQKSTGQKMRRKRRMRTNACGGLCTIKTCFQSPAFSNDVFSPTIHTMSPCRKTCEASTCVRFC